MSVYKAFFSISTLLYGSEAWTTYSKHEKRLNVFHLRCLRRILNISWQDKVTNVEVLQRASLPSMFTLLKQRRLRWLGHVYRMEDARIPKAMLYGELCEGNRGTGRPKLRYKDVVKKDMKDLEINTNTWEAIAADRSRWKTTLTQRLKSGEEKRIQSAAAKREKRKAQALAAPAESNFICGQCRRDCHSRIGLSSHLRTHNR